MYEKEDADTKALHAITGWDEAVFMERGKGKRGRPGDRPDLDRRDLDRTRKLPDGAALEGEILKYYLEVPRKAEVHDRWR